MCGVGLWNGDFRSSTGIECVGLAEGDLDLLQLRTDTWNVVWRYLTGIRLPGHRISEWFGLEGP